MQACGWGPSMHARLGWLCFRCHACLTDNAHTLLHAAYGPVAEVKLHKKGGYGFVKFDDHDSAVKAIVDMHGKELYGRVSTCPNA